MQANAVVATYMLILSCKPKLTTVSVAWLASNSGLIWFNISSWLRKVL